jgi:tetratricopeptide (TPR) repeat protein
MHRRRIWWTAGLIAALTALAVLAWRWVRAPSGPRVLLVGVDGADPQIVDRLIAEGRLPTFARLRREGASGRLRSREPLLSPIVWTTIATGRKAQDHGVLDFVEIGRDGQPVPITSGRRRVAALWNVASEHGLRTGFIGWYGSFPAERVQGFQVSDRLAFHQVRSQRATEGATHPDALADDLRRRLGEPTPDLTRTRERFLADPRATLSPDGERRLGELARIHATSEFYRRALPLLEARYRPDLLGVYFELVDACGHLFMEDAPPRRPEVSDEDFRAFAGTVDRCYEYQDAVLADVLKLAGRHTVTLVLSDHGFKSGQARPHTSGRADVGLAPLWHRLHGVIFVDGAGTRPGTIISGATILDVAPTVLGLLSLPLSRELPGHPLREAFTQWHDPPTVAAYAAPPVSRAAARSAAPEDAERVEQLRALGYLGGGGGTAAPAHDEQGRTVASYLNEGSARAADGDTEAALRAWARALALDPGNVNARVYAARTHIEQGELARARRLLDEATALDPRNPGLRLQRANLAFRSRDWKAAAAELQAAEAIDDRLPNVRLLEARLADATGRPADALVELRKAEALTDAEGLLAEILLLEADLELRLGRTESAAGTIARAAPVAPASRLVPLRAELALRRGDSKQAVALLQPAALAAPNDPVVLRKLGQALAAAGDAAGAEAAMRRAVETSSDDDAREGAYGDLSLLFQQQGREEAAGRTLEEAVRRLPRSAALWGMLGAARGRAGQLDTALRAYERSVALQPTALGCKTLAALVFERRHDRRRAVRLWEQSLALDPRQPDVEAFLQKYGNAKGP